MSSIADVDCYTTWTPERGGNEGGKETVTYQTECGRLCDLYLPPYNRWTEGGEEERDKISLVKILQLTNCQKHQKTDLNLIGVHGSSLKSLKKTSKLGLELGTLGV